MSMGCGRENLCGSYGYCPGDCPFLPQIISPNTMKDMTEAYGEVMQESGVQVNAMYRADRQTSEMATFEAEAKYKYHTLLFEEDHKPFLIVDNQASRQVALAAEAVRDYPVDWIGYLTILAENTKNWQAYSAPYVIDLVSISTMAPDQAILSTHTRNQTMDVRGNSRTCLLIEDLSATFHRLQPYGRQYLHDLLIEGPYKGARIMAGVTPSSLSLMNRNRIDIHNLFIQK